VHPFFWLTSVLLGSSILQDPSLDPPVRFLYLFLWVGASFVSILIHEMGHVVVGRYYGADGHIVLAGLFGLAIGSGDVPTRGQRIAVSFAGPAAQFLLIGVLLGGIAIFDADPVVRMGERLTRFEFPYFYALDWPDWLNYLMLQLVWINLIWALVNLLPIWPLDGGKISRELFQHFLRADGVRWSLIVSLATAGTIAVNGLLTWLMQRSLIPLLGVGTGFTVIFFGLFAYGSWQALQQLRHGGGGGGRYRFEDDSYERAPWERDADWWKRG
ncbi:MAG: site-2 protease family protein, partial [Planctomycetia bacterium]|nr:site-2 protease family protein [Planctomycetia bacterium]